MKCSVPYCPEKVTTSFGKNDEFHFCKAHKEAWHYYYPGFRKASGYGCDGLIHKKNWDEAMREFLDYCRVEVVALNQLEEAYRAVIRRVKC